MAGAAIDPIADLASLPGVFEAVDAARGAVDALLRDLRSPALRMRVPEVTAECLRRSARASALLEIAPADAPSAWSVEEFRPPFAADVAGRTAAGCLRVAATMPSLAEVMGRSPLQALARLHALAAADLVGAGRLGADQLGRPRSDPAVGPRLTALATLLTAPTSAPAIVVAAVAHGELLALEPFAWGDGVVARAASRLVMVARGLDPHAVVVAEEGQLALGAERQAAALEAYRSGTPAGLAAWLGHCAAAVTLGARAGREIAATLIPRRS